LLDIHCVTISVIDDGFTSQVVERQDAASEFMATKKEKKKNHFFLDSLKNVFIGDIVSFGVYPFCRLDFSNVTENVFLSMKIGHGIDKNVVCLQCTMNMLHLIKIILGFTYPYTFTYSSRSFFAKNTEQIYIKSNTVL